MNDPKGSGHFESEAWLPVCSLHKGPAWESPCSGYRAILSLLLVSISELLHELGNPYVQDLFTYDL